MARDAVVACAANEPAMIVTLTAPGTNEPVT